MGKVVRMYKRAMAILMAIALVISTFQSMSVTAYAKESGSEISATDDESESSETDVSLTGEESESGEADVPAPGEETESGEADVPAPGEEIENSETDVPAPGEETESSETDVPAPGEETESGEADAPAPGEGTESGETDVPATGEDLEIGETEEVEDGETDIPAEEELAMVIEEEIPLEAGATEPLYTGEYDEETGTLTLSVAAIREAYGTFDDETLLTVLGGIEVTPCVGVEIDYDDKQTTISQEVWNATAGLLTEGSGLIMLCFEGGEQEDEIWTFSNPTTAEADINLAYTMTVNAARTGILIAFEDTGLPAWGAGVEFVSDSSKTGHAALLDAFWHNQATEVRDENGNTLEGSIAAFGVDENNVIHLEVGIFSKEDTNTYQLTSGQTYTIVAPFKGIMWGEEVIGLDIFPGMVEKEAFTVAELQSILAENKDTRFDEIYVAYPSAESMNIEADAVNAMTGYLRWAENIEQYVKFGFEDSELGVSKEIRILNPQDAETTDKTITANLVFTDNNKVSVTVSGVVFQAERTDIWFNYPQESQEGTALKAIFGEGEQELIVNDSEAWAYYGQVDDTVYLQIFNAGRLADHTEYIVEKDIYPGHEEDNEEGHVLNLHANDIEKETFATGDLKEQLSSYLSAIKSGEKAPFNVIRIEQKFVSGSNVIRKDDINFLRQLLAEDDGFNRCDIIYTFCRCEYDEETCRTYTNDVVWTLNNPGKAEKNINANITYSLIPGQGVSLKVKDNTFKADNVTLEFISNERTQDGSILAGILGEDEYGGELAVLKKADNSLFDNLYANYWNDNENENRGIHIPDVSAYKSTVEYLFVPIQDISGNEAEDFQFYIGEAEQNLSKLITTRTPDEGTAVTWKSYDTSKLRIAADGASVEAMNVGTVCYLATYQSGGIQVLDVFRNYIDAKVNEILFDKETLTMVLPEEWEEWTSEDYLRVKYYPAVAAIDQVDLEWTVEMLEGENVIELAKFYMVIDQLDDGTLLAEWRNTGGIIARNPGVAKVTATVPGTDISASCVVTVEAPAVVPENAWPTAWAITNIDTTLETVEFQMEEGAQGSWRWEDNTTSLASFKTMPYHDFNAIYTTADGREIRCKVGVNMVNITDLRILGLEMDEAQAECYEVDPYSILEKGTSMVVNYDYIMNNDGYGIIERYLENGRLSVEWSSDPAGLGTTQGVEEEGYWPGSYKLTADEQSGKKTITVSLVDTKENEAIVSTSHVVTVPADTLTAWDRLEVEWQSSNEKVVGVAGEKGTLILRLPKDGYHALTITSLDTGICKLGRQVRVDKTSEEDYVLTKIPYEIKAKGIIYLAVKSADEVKSNIRIERTILDITPKHTGEVLAINKQWEDKADEFVIQMAAGCELTTDVQDITLSGTGAKYFAITDITDNGDQTISLKVELADDTAVNKTYDLKVNNLAIAYDDGEETANDTFPMNLKVKVTNTKPSVTFGQSNKINLFYTDDEGYANLTVKAGKETVTDITLGDYVDKKPKNNAVCDYELVQPEEGIYIIKPKDDTTGAKKKGTITYRVEGYEGIYSATFTVKAENEAPEISLSAKQDILYPYKGDDNTTLELIDKNTKEPIAISTLQWIKNANKKVYVDIPKEGEWDSENPPIIRITNEYLVEYSQNRICFTIQDGEMASKKETVQMQVQEENWSKPVKVTYSITPKFNAPSLVLGSKTITLNVNQDIYEHQMAGTTLKFKNATENLKYMDVYFVGTDDKSRKALNENLILEYWGDQGLLWAKFNAKNLQDRLKADTYTYNVCVNLYGNIVKTQLKVKVVDKPVEDCLEVTKKGSIDVLNREGTAITFAPEKTTLTGKIVDAHLVGKDADMFDCYWENNKLAVYARVGTQYSTKYTYKVQPVFHVENEYWDYYEITGKEQSIKVKQGTPKVTASAPKNILYRDRGNALEIGFKAVLNKKTNVVIDNVELLNYTSDFRLKEWPQQDEAGNEYYVTFNPDTQTVTLSQEWITKVVAKNQKVKLKFAVYYRDKAGNENAAQATYEIIVK